MGQDLVTIVRLVPRLELAEAGRRGGLLNLLRRIVREVRREESGLDGLELKEVGFVGRGSQVELRLHFQRHRPL
jgi:hypothetical protein